MTSGCQVVARAMPCDKIFGQPAGRFCRLPAFRRSLRASPDPWRRLRMKAPPGGAGAVRPSTRKTGSRSALQHGRNRRFGANMAGMRACFLTAGCAGASGPLSSAGTLTAQVRVHAPVSTTDTTASADAGRAQLLLGADLAGDAACARRDPAVQHARGDARARRRRAAHALRHDLRDAAFAHRQLEEPRTISSSPAFSMCCRSRF